jgi:hypothetical protein
MEPAEEPEELPEKDKFRIEKDPANKISMSLIAKTSLDGDAVSSLSEDEK